MIEPRTIHPFRRECPGRRQALAEGGFGFLGQQQAAKAACPVRQRGGDGMVAIKPDGAPGRFRRAPRRSAMAAMGLATVRLEPAAATVSAAMASAVPLLLVAVPGLTTPWMRALFGSWSATAPERAAVGRWTGRSAGTIPVWTIPIGATPTGAVIVRRLHHTPIP
jgi:hypothetical protein